MAQIEIPIFRIGEYERALDVLTLEHEGACVEDCIGGQVQGLKVSIQKWYIERGKAT